MIKFKYVSYLNLEKMCTHNYTVQTLNKLDTVNLKWC